MDLERRTVVLAGTFSSLSPAEARDRLVAVGARVASSLSEETDLLFAGDDAVAETDDAFGWDIPIFDENALRWLTEPGRPSPAPKTIADFEGGFPDHAALASAGGPAGLAALLATADWSAFVPARDLPPLRARLVELEREYGVTEAHGQATRRLQEAAEVHLRQPYGHQSAIHTFALSPCRRYLATGCSTDDAYEDGGALQVWEVAAGRCVNILRHVEGGVGWPGFARTIQWSADSSRLGMSYHTNLVGVWDPFQEGSEPLASFSTADGNSRPSSFALSPDGQRVYLQRYNGQGGVDGLVVPMCRGNLFWSPTALEGEHPYTLYRELPAELQAAIDAEVEEDEGPDGFRYGVWLETPRWSANGSRLLGDQLSIDVDSKLPHWYEPTIREPVAYSPSGALLAHATARGLQFRDAHTGRALGDAFPLGPLSSLHWVRTGEVERLAAVTLAGDGGPPCVHVFDGSEHRLRMEIAHPGWEVDPYREDDAAWSWSPEGERAVALTDRGTAEVWSLTGAEPCRLRSFPVPEHTSAVLWGAQDTVAVVAAEAVRFVRADSGETVGDFVFQREPTGPHPLAGPRADQLFGEQVFPLDEADWGVVLRPGAVIAPAGRAKDLDAVLTWSVERRHAWPLRWGEPEVLPDVRKAAERLISGDGDLLRRHLPELLPPPDEPKSWPSGNTADLDDLVAAALASVTGLGEDSQDHVSNELRCTARLQARRGRAKSALELVRAVPQSDQRVAAAADVAVILAGQKDSEAAGAALALAERQLDDVLETTYRVADVASSFGAACHLLGPAGRADTWFARARAAISFEPNPWEDCLAVLHSLVECGRADEAREMLAEPDSLPPQRPSDTSWLIYLMRAGQLGLAREMLPRYGLFVPPEVLTELAELGRPELLGEWETHRRRVPEELVARAREVAVAGGTPVVRPPVPTREDIAALTADHTELQRTPRAQRRRPTELLIERAAASGHLSAVLYLLSTLPATGYNRRPQAAFAALWRAATGHHHYQGW